MDRDMFDQWLQRYIDCQERGEPEGIRQLWAEDGVYWWGPFEEPRYGVEAVYEHHRDALSHQSDWKCECEVLAVTDKYGIARFHLTLNDEMLGAPNTYDGIFLVHLDDEGRCTLFQEWYHSTKTPDQD
jgi:hypothetical protein